MQDNEQQVTPQQLAQHIAQMLQQAQQECRADIGRVSDGKAQALFETIAEVLGGAMKALNDYQNGSEGVWQTQGGSQQGEQTLRGRTEAMPEYQRTGPVGPQPPVVTEMAPDINETHPPSKLFTE